MRSYRSLLTGVCLTVLLSLLLSACNLPGSTRGAAVWLDVPVDGVNYPAIQEVNIQGHATGPGGVSRVEIWINGALLTTTNNPPLEGELASFQTTWTPSEVGIYTIQAVAYASDGTASQPDSARITIAGEAPTRPAGCPSPVGGGATPVTCSARPAGCPSPVGGGATPVTCSARPAGCPSPVGGGATPVTCAERPAGCPTPVGGGATPVTCGAAPVGCPSPVGGGPTLVPPCVRPPVGCPSPVGGGATPVSCEPGSLPIITVIVPGGDVQFWADPAEIDAGACTNIRWQASNVKAVVFGGVGQPLTGSYDACLCADERYTLTVTHLDGTEERRTVDVRVNGSCVTPVPVDTDPPPVPEPAVPGNGLTLSCRSSQNLVWLPVSDPSKIAEYRVQVQRQSGDGNWQAAPGGAISGIHDKQTSISVECGWYYRWRVRALDGVGNLSGWSGWSEFTVTLE